MLVYSQREGKVTLWGSINGKQIKEREYTKSNSKEKEVIDKKSLDEGWDEWRRELLEAAATTDFTGNPFEHLQQWIELMRKASPTKKIRKGGINFKGRRQFYSKQQGLVEKQIKALEQEVIRVTKLGSGDFRATGGMVAMSRWKGMDIIVVRVLPSSIHPNQMLKFGLLFHAILLESAHQMDLLHVVELLPDIGIFLVGTIAFASFSVCNLLPVSARAASRYLLLRVSRHAQLLLVLFAPHSLRPRRCY